MQSAEKNATTFPTTNPHAEHFSEFQNTRLFDRLQQKFTPKPYWKQYQILRIVVLASSYLFHVLSAATAAALVFLFIRGLTQSAIVSGVLTAVVLAALEIAKRITSTRLFSSWFQFGKLSAGLALSALCLSALSTAAAYFGSQRMVVELTPPAQQINVDSLTTSLREQIAIIDSQTADARKQTWKGKPTAAAQRTIERLTRQKETALAELVRQQQRIDAKNDTTEQIHQETTTANAGQFAAFTLVCEILLLLAIFYLEYYDYRSYAEHCKSPIPERPNTSTAGVNIAGEFLNGKARPTAVANLRGDENRLTKIVATSGNLRSCDHCGNQYEHRHAKQKYCCDSCRIQAWQDKTGKEIKRRTV
jgi:hypothetical protein